MPRDGTNTPSIKRVNPDAYLKGEIGVPLEFSRVRQLTYQCESSRI
jgi:hypothetical protein